MLDPLEIDELCCVVLRHRTLNPFDVNHHRLDSAKRERRAIVALERGDVNDQWICCGRNPQTHLTAHAKSVITIAYSCVVRYLCCSSQFLFSTWTLCCEMSRYCDCLVKLQSGWLSTFGC